MWYCLPIFSLTRISIEILEKQSQQHEQGQCGLSLKVNPRFLTVFQDFVGCEVAIESNAKLVAWTKLETKERYSSINLQWCTGMQDKH